MAKKPIRHNFKVKRNLNTRKTMASPIRKRFINPKIQDARQKLIQKKRNNLVDARDVLAKMAKTQDARAKLNKLRQNRPGTANNVKVIGANIVQKTDRNGKISLITNKAKTGINMLIQKQLGLIANSQNIQRKQEALLTARRPLISQARLTPQIQRSQRTQLDEIGLVETEFNDGYTSDVYKWAKPAASQLIGALGARNRLIAQEWQNFPVKKTLSIPQNYVDLDAAMEVEEMPLTQPQIKQTISLQGSSRVSNIHSRLDNIPIQPETHGILSLAASQQTKTKVVVPAGHRIVISNLQPSVTQDDVKELFEDIGQLLTARLVRPGIAEVIYKNLKDAQKAVDTYHNRQLDGQPMKCLLVNKRPLNNPTALPFTKMEQGNNTVDGEQQNTHSLVPDLSTIHKVLFQRK